MALTFKTKGFLDKNNQTNKNLFISIGFERLRVIKQHPRQFVTNGS